MNNIGFGILCFGEDYYFRGAEEKLRRILASNFHGYVLTDNPKYFKDLFAPAFTHVIPYHKEVKSYHDKMILPKYILPNHDYCVLIDADLHIINYDFLTYFTKCKINPGITYIDTLKNHPGKKEFIKDIDMSQAEWQAYKNYAEHLLPAFGDMETIWEYLLIISKLGFNQNEFYSTYEKLQLAKDFSDITLNKEVNGAGEGISLAIASKLSNTTIQRDLEFYDKHKDSFTSVSRRFTNPEFWPDWMK
jgi:hypothetical protein